MKTRPGTTGVDPPMPPTSIQPRVRNQHDRRNEPAKIPISPRRPAYERLGHLAAVAAGSFASGEGGFGAVEEVAPGIWGAVLGDAEGGGEGGAVGAEGGADGGGAAAGQVGRALRGVA